MYAVSLDNLSPRELLETVEKAPYPFSEKVNDIAVPVIRHLLISVLYPVAAAVVLYGYINSLAHYYYPDSYLQKSNLIPLTEDAIQKSSHSEEEKETLRLLLSRNKKFSEKLKLAPLQMNISNKELPMWTHLPKEELTAQIAIKQSILHQKARGKATIFDAAVLLSNIAFFSFLPRRNAIAAALAVNFIASIIFSQLVKFLIRSVYQTAMGLLNSNQGIAAIVARQLKENYLQKQELISSGASSFKQLQLTPQGNSRSYPFSLTERLGDALAFKALDETSQTLHADASG